MGRYIYDQAWEAEKRRLDALGRLYDRGTIRHLRDTGVGPGWRCWEAGAGSGTIARWLAAQVGEEGRVLVTDLDTRFVEDLHGRAVEVRVHDVTGEPPGEGFDLVHARALLEHLPAREVALARMLAALRPGGWIVVEDVVTDGVPAAAPELPLLAKLMRAFALGFRAAGADPVFALALEDALTRAGAVDVGVHCRVPIIRFGTPDTDFMTLSLSHLRERFVGAGLLDDTEVDELLAAAATPGRVATGPAMVAAWGRRPG